MNSFDAGIIHFLNSFSQKSMFFDRLMNFIVDDYFIKGAIILSFLWAFWFQKGGKINNKKGVIIGFLSTFIAIIVGRILELTLPFRIRPVYNPGLTFLRPYRFSEYGLDSWSSFPSDHAVMFFALATSVFLMSKKIGTLVYLYVFLIICFPRMYLGLHYPTDILAGAMIGTLITIFVARFKMGDSIANKILEFSRKYEGLFYALFFLLSFQIATMFFEIRTIGQYLFELLD